MDFAKLKQLNDKLSFVLTKKREVKKVTFSLRNDKSYFNYLPEEILEMILGYLTNPKDLYNCCLASARCDKILTPKKTRFLFNLVLPNIAPGIGTVDIVECRQVCHSWKLALDSLFTITPFQDPFDRLVRYEILVCFRRTSEITQFAEEMEDCVGNPFIGRQVHFNCIDTIEQEDEHMDVRDEYIGNFWEITGNFLFEHGKHIWNTSFALGTFTYELPYPNQLALGGCLRFLPNLKQLCVTGCGAAVSEPVLRGYMGRIFELEKEYPELPQLFSLKIDSAPGCTSRLLFLKYAKQLRKLEVQNRDFDHATVYSKGVDIDLPKLEELRITVKNSLSWRDLSKLLFLRSPLKKLDMLVHNEIKIANVLQVLEHFKDTLVHVRLEVLLSRLLKKRNRCPSRVLDPPPGFSLPHVHTVELINYLGSHNFLLNVPKLKQLYVKFSNSPNSRIHKEQVWEKERTKERIQIYGYVEHMYKSNIWIKILSLDKFVFEWRLSNNKKHGEKTVYTRKEYLCQDLGEPASGSFVARIRIGKRIT